jgi:hypothetical protein
LFGPGETEPTNAKTDSAPSSFTAGADLIR